MTQAVMQHARPDRKSPLGRILERKGVRMWLGFIWLRL
jgi:hypothetical protein